MDSTRPLTDVAFVSALFFATVASCAVAFVTFGTTISMAGCAVLHGGMADRCGLGVEIGGTARVPAIKRPAQSSQYLAEFEKGSSWFLGGSW